jgi:hypothetical protein
MQATSKTCQKEQAELQAQKSTANCRQKKKKERAYCWHPPEWGFPLQSEGV